MKVPSLNPSRTYRASLTLGEAQCHSSTRQHHAARHRDIIDTQTYTHKQNTHTQTQTHRHRNRHKANRPRIVFFAHAWGRLRAMVNLAAMIKHTGCASAHDVSQKPL